MKKKQAKNGVLLINLGTPNQPTTGAIRRYLREFLSDPRIMDIPLPVRWMILNLMILPFRPRHVKKKYQKIWMQNGSPLLVHSRNLKTKLTDALGAEYHVELAMRYGKPSIRQALQHLNTGLLQHLQIIPLMPQYAPATSGSIIQKVMEEMASWQVFPEIHITREFYQNENYIQAVAENGASNLLSNPDHTLFSFHGLPERQVLKADAGSHHCLQSETCCSQMSDKNAGCYRAQCYHTAAKISEHLNILPENYSVSFQSRLGKTKWIEPYTSDRIIELAEKGVKDLLVFSPAFVADCLESLEEIQIHGKGLFKQHGGKTLTLVPSLNSDERWVQTLKEIVEKS